MKHYENNLKGGLKLETKRVNYYQTVEVYKKIIRQRTKEGRDSQSLRKRLLAIMTNGKN